MSSPFHAKRLRTIAAISAMSLSQILHAQVTVTEPWLRASAPGQRAAGVFMQLKADASARLVSASSPAAKTVEIHEMTMENGLMKMRSIPGVEIPAGQSLALKPGGYHVMLIDLKQPIKAGDVVPVTLVFESLDKKTQSLEVKAVARALGADAGHGSHKH